MKLHRVYYDLCRLFCVFQQFDNHSSINPHSALREDLSALLTPLPRSLQSVDAALNNHFTCQERTHKIDELFNVKGKYKIRKHNSS